MHELGLSEAILEAVQRRAEGRRVKSFTVRVGVMHRVDQASLDQAFSMVAAGTEAQDAAVQLVAVPVQAVCRACGHRDDGEDMPGACPSCGSGDLEVTGGDELLLESIEVEAPT